VPGRSNTMNARQPGLRLADARRESPARLGTETPIDAATVAAELTTRIAHAVRVAEMTAVRHQLDGCPTPATCRPCAAAERRRVSDLVAERRRLHEQDEAELRASRRRARAGRLIEGMVASASGATAVGRPIPWATLLTDAGFTSGQVCEVCREVEVNHGTATCRSCGIISEPEIASVLSALNGRSR
jgi:hypothetical protein